MQLTYTGGDDDWCAEVSPGKRQKRSLELALECDPSTSTSFAELSITEEYNCFYRMWIQHISGCPRECLTSGETPTVCNGRGVCGFDTDHQESHCFCNDGYAGEKCGSKAKDESSKMSTEGVFLVLVVLILVAVVALTGYMLLRLRRLSVDPAAYGELQGRFNELGQIA